MRFLEEQRLISGNFSANCHRMKKKFVNFFFNFIVDECQNGVFKLKFWQIFDSYKRFKKKKKREGNSF